MSQGDANKSVQADPSSLEEMSSLYAAELDSALKTARKTPRDTSLQRVRLSERFARRVRVGDPSESEGKAEMQYRHPA